MADFSITISNSVNVFGASPSTKWNDFQWGVGTWGEGTNSIIKEVDKALAETLTLTDALTLETDFVRTIDNSLALESDMSFEGLKSGEWSYVFTGPTTNAENRPAASFTIRANGSTVWTSGAATSTSWSTT
jgi:hypothetical protein